MPSCISCFSELTQKEKPEHILLNALGGRKKTKSILCSICNEKMGAGPDKCLADSTAFIRNIMHFKSGKNSLPPTIKNIEVDGQKYNLKPGGMPLKVGFEALRFEETNKGENIRIQARDLEHLETLKVQIAKRYDISLDEVETIISDCDWEYKTRPAPFMNVNMAFGGYEAMRSMAKSCFVLWSIRVGNGEAINKKYNDIRSFIFTGDDSLLQNITQMDTRELIICNQFLETYSPNPNVIYVTSNEEGRVLGYFILYGLCAWSFELCKSGGQPNSSIGLISNPYDSSVFSVDIATSHPISFQWIQAANYDEGDKNIISQLKLLHEKYLKLSMEKEHKKIFYETMKNQGLIEGDKFTEEFFVELAERMTCLALKQPYVKKFKSW